MDIHEAARLLISRGHDGTFMWRVVKSGRRPPYVSSIKGRSLTEFEAIAIAREYQRRDDEPDA